MTVSLENSYTGMVEVKEEFKDFLQDDPKDHKKPVLTVIVFLAVFLLGMLSGGFIVYKKGNVSLPKETATEGQKQPSPSVAPTKKPVDLSQYTIEILNGSKAKGAAGLLKETLSEEGFNVASAGNATSSTFTKTIVSAKKEVDQSYLVKLEDFLSEFQALSINQDLEADAQADVVIIIGEE